MESLTGPSLKTDGVVTATPTCRLRKCPFSTQTCSGERPHRSRVLTCAPCVSRSRTIRCWLVAAAICRAVCVAQGHMTKRFVSGLVFFFSPPAHPVRPGSTSPAPCAPSGPGSRWRPCWRRARTPELGVPSPRRCGGIWQTRN